MKALLLAAALSLGSFLALGQTVSGPPTNYAVPGPIGGTTPAAGSFTTLTATSTTITPSVTSASGDEILGASSGNVRIGTGSVPTIASGACGTTTNGTIAAASRSNAGTVVIGAASTTVCTVVFASAMATAPVCTISPANAAAAAVTVLPYISANTVNGFVITGAVLANTNFNYHCI